MNSKADVNRRVLAIQAKKKRHKPNKKKGKQQQQQNRANSTATTSNQQGGVPNQVQQQKINQFYSKNKSELGENYDATDSVYSNVDIQPQQQICNINNKICNSTKNQKISGLFSSLSSSSNNDNNHQILKKCSSGENSKFNNKMLPTDLFIGGNSRHHITSATTATTMINNDNRYQTINPPPPPPPPACYNTTNLNKIKYKNQPSSSNESGESELNSEDDEQELKEDYCKGGYHPVNIGDLFQGNILIMKATKNSVVF